MSGINNENNAGFFQLVHQLVRPPTPAEHESRELSRHQFGSYQRVAPWDGERFPRGSEFSVVRCNDLNRRGFSFFSPNEPGSTQVVVALTGPAETLYLVAEIVRVETVWLDPSGRVDRRASTDDSAGGEGRIRMFLAGCRFTRRLERPTGHAD